MWAPRSPSIRPGLGAVSSGQCLLEVDQGVAEKRPECRRYGRLGIRSKFGAKGWLGFGRAGGNFAFHHLECARHCSMASTPAHVAGSMRGSRSHTAPHLPRALATPVGMTPASLPIRPRRGPDVQRRPLSTGTLRLARKRGLWVHMVPVDRGRRPARANVSSRKYAAGGNGFRLKPDY